MTELPASLAFSTIVGQGRAVSLLRETVARGRLHHALLFSGPKGVGKYRTAQAFAAWLLCKSPRQQEACECCTSCRSVSGGTHVDMRVETLHVEENKRDISIEQVRENVQKFLMLQPIAGGRKIVVIDEAQTLSLPAQNSFLKTLEEPPGNSLIILVAHNASALLPTVRSRCQRVSFAPLTEAEIEEILLRESHGRSRKDARLLAAYANGSLGVALSADANWLREAIEQMRSIFDGTPAARYAEISDLARKILGLERTTGPERMLKILARLNLPLTLLRHGLREAAGLPAPPAIGSMKAPSLRAALHATESTYAAWVDLRRNANPSIALEALWIRVTEAFANP